MIVFYLALLPGVLGVINEIHGIIFAHLFILLGQFQFKKCFIKCVSGN